MESEAGVVESLGSEAAIVRPSRADSESGLARVLEVERYGAEDSARVVVHASREVPFRLGTFEPGGPSPRVFVDLLDSTLEGPIEHRLSGLVRRVRLNRAGEDGVRVVLDLARPANPRVFYLLEPFRLVIDVSAARADDPVASGRRRVERVVLDPGHGGHDPGAIGPSGLREKDVTLDIAHRTAPILARELGVTTLLTRDGDTSLPLHERIARANGFNADLFISIHCNASEERGGKGVMTFVFDAAREEVAERIAERENAASRAAAAELLDVLRRASALPNQEASLHFAGLLQRAAMSSLRSGYPDIPNGGVKRAGFYVLAGARMPAVLFETSFISTERGEARFGTEEFRQRLADAIVNAIRAYRAGI
ncbi:MAG TPA: N-acetylmuramoyl-L-alanine amidase [Polyangiaceae bacterium]|nr:N-acetylmuramoyl-L-alanine amidase [Polyangiaceae bacterium]